MSTSLLILTSSVILVYLITFIYISKYRREVPSMVGMIAAMALGMMIGLLGGTIAGVYFVGNLFLSTLVGGGIGFLAGTFIGLPFNLLSTIEGMLSGLMGGMMGAMLGAMIPSVYADAIIKLLFSLELLFNLIILYLLISEGPRGKESIGRRWFENPALMSTTLALFFFFFNMAGPIAFPKQPPHVNHTSQSSNGSTKDMSSIIEINAEDFSYSPHNIKFKKSQTVTIRLKNVGQVEHDLQVKGLKAEVIESESHHSGDQRDLHIHAMPGENSSITFKPLETGRFEFYCTLPGHKESGMAGTFDVL